MQKFLDWIDRLAAANHENKFALWLERIAFVFLILMILSAPHSIAATQTAWILGMLALVVRFYQTALKTRSHAARCAALGVFRVVGLDLP
jgi:hypothetical protein